MQYNDYGFFYSISHTQIKDKQILSELYKGSVRYCKSVINSLIS